MSTDIVLIEETRNLPAFSSSDSAYLVEHKEHLQAVLTKTHMWRTDVQKRQILNDVHFPTIHAKFHQAILEQKIQLDNSLYLAKDFELKKCEIEELELDIEELGDSRRDEIKRRKFDVELKFKQYELSQMKTAMNYRMAEIKGWQVIIEELQEILRDSGMSEEVIWSKNDGEFSAMFYTALNNAMALETTTDSAERGNITAALHFVVKQAKAAGQFDKLAAGCSESQAAVLKKYVV